MNASRTRWSVALVLMVILGLATGPAVAQQKRPNVVMLMMDGVGWNDFGVYSAFRS